VTEEKFEQAGDRIPVPDFNLGNLDAQSGLKVRTRRFLV